MRKFVLFALFVSLLCAESELKQPLSAENAPQKPLQSTQEQALQNQNLQENALPQNEQKAINSAQNENAPLNSNQNSSLAEDDEPNIYDFAKIAAREYNGEDTTINILRIKTHDTNYFLPFAYAFHGRPNDPKYKQAETKFQFSVKKVLFENVLFLGESWNFGYTQTAWWQMYAESAPFRELNYAPELFVSFPFSGFGWLKSMSVGFMHQSNGKDGADSRSWNRVYANAVFHHKRFVFLPRLWYIVPESSLDENKDIRKYLGNFDAKIAYLGRDTFAYILLRNNLNFKHNKGAVELNAGFDLFDNGVFWFVQYFNGYGESLIDYQRYINKLGIGFVVAY